MTDNKIVFKGSDGEEVEFLALEQTKINGINYVLVADSEDEDEANALILKDISDENSQEATYAIVEDDIEFNALAKVFSELMEDIDIEIQQ